MADITILGSGGFGLSLAVLCNTNGHKVTVWSKFQDEIDAIKRTGELKAKLPGVFIPEEIKFSTDISCVKDADMVLIGIPSNFVREVCQTAAPYMSKKTVVVNTSKGLEEGSLKRMSQVVGECFPENKIVVLTGPSHAEEVARGIPTAVVAACKDIDAASFAQEVFTSGNFRIYINDDVVGSEIGGSLKNVIALACGVVDGMGLGDNTKAAVMTRGLREITVLGEALGADTETFCGLSGLGDLIVTCTSMHSRNRRAGILIGQGKTPEEAVRQVGTVEGYFCTKTAYALGKKMGVEMPITEALWKVLFEKLSPEEASQALMSRPAKNESDLDFNK